jgi:hypothetical protein
MSQPRSVPIDLPDLSGALAADNGLPANPWAMVSEIEIWQSAKLMVAQHGEDAFARAEERAAALKTKGDIDGWATWVRIAAAILEIQSNSSKRSGS